MCYGGKILLPPQMVEILEVKMKEKIWSWIEKNRFTVIAFILAMVLWFGGFACEPTVISPVNPDKLVTAAGLQDEYDLWQAGVNITANQFERAGQDLQKQAEGMAKLGEFIIGLASGVAPNLSGLLQMLLGGGVLGLFADNLRKNGVIVGLKRNK